MARHQSVCVWSWFRGVMARRSSYAYGLVGALVLAVLYPQAASAQTGPFCGGGTTQKCIVSVTTTTPATPSSISASLQFASGTGAFTLIVKNTANPDPFELASDLSTASEVTVVFKVSSESGAVDPKIAVSTGLVSSWTLNTAVSPHEITFVANPRSSSWNGMGVGCSPSNCATTADVDYQALLLAAFDPMQASPSPDFTTKFKGGFIATNAQYFDPFPNYNATTKAMDLLVGAPHLKLAGPANTGFVRMFVPDAVITDLWGISGGSAALKADKSLATVTVGGSTPDFSIDKCPDAIACPSLPTGVLLHIGEVTPFGYSVPDVVVKPSTSGSTGSPAPKPAPTPTPFPPSITAIANQYVSPGGTATVSFTVSGAIDAQYLAVGASAYDPVLLPASALRLTHGSGGSWTLTITAPPTRTGATVVQVMADDGFQNAGTAFVVTITTQARRPSGVTATSSGSGIVLTWLPVNGATPVRYAIAGGTTPGGTELPVVVTPDAATSFVIPMVPPGTYYFRVHAVFSDGVSLASDEASVAASGSTSASGPPSGLRASVSGHDVTLQWQAPAFGAAPTLYEVEFGTAAGKRDLAIITAVNPTHTTRLEAGVYFTRVHTFRGGTVSAGSNEAAVSVDPGGCTAPPNAPLFLPPSVTNGLITFSWLPSSSVVDNYWVEILPSSGGVSGISINGTGTSFVWKPTVASGSARVVATNLCGAGPRSNEMPFVGPR